MKWLSSGILVAALIAPVALLILPLILLVMSALITLIQTLKGKSNAPLR